MNPFEYQNPVKVIFGAGKLSCLGEEAAKLGKHAFVVSYKDHAALDATLTKVCSLLKSAGLKVTTYYAASRTRKSPWLKLA